MKSLFNEIKIHRRVYYYCQDHGKCRELEQLIATDLRHPYVYVRDIIGGRFELGEGVIARDEYYQNEYREFLETL